MHSLVRPRQVQSATTFSCGGFIITVDGGEGGSLFSRIPRASCASSRGFPETDLGCGGRERDAPLGTGARCSTSRSPHSPVCALRRVVADLTRFGELTTSAPRQPERGVVPPLHIPDRLLAIRKNSGKFFEGA